ncbi:MAG: repressor LexA [Planctomycetes bacterium]|nr:repressor LexA [Planctomycetota bacterium]
MSHPLSKKQLEVLKALESFAKARGHIPSVRELASRLRKSPTTVFQHLKALERRGYLKGDGSAHGWRLLQASGATASGGGESRQLTAMVGGLAAEMTREPEFVRQECDVDANDGAADGGDGEERIFDRSPTPRSPVPAHADDAVPAGWVRVAIAGSIAAGAPIEAIEDTQESRIFPAEMVPPDAFALKVRGHSMIDDHICDGDLVIVEPQDEVRDGEIAVALLDDGSATLKRVFRESGRVRLQPANATMAPIYAADVTIQGRVVGVWRRCD